MNADEKEALGLVAGGLGGHLMSHFLRLTAFKGVA